MYTVEKVKTSEVGQGNFMLDNSLFNNS